jgi:uncharacterized membrane protein YphA (DoxX/SURF4 family)
MEYGITGGGSMNILRSVQCLLITTQGIDFLGPLALRLYLAPVFWMAGTEKLGDIESTAAWFGNPDRGCRFQC